MYETQANTIVNRLDLSKDRERQVIRFLQRVSYDRLESFINIRRLRNDVAHFNRIIYRDIYKNLDLWGVYENIIELFELLGYDKNEVNCIVNDLNSQQSDYYGNSFEILYQELKQINAVKP